MPLDVVDLLQRVIAGARRARRGGAATAAPGQPTQPAAPGQWAPPVRRPYPGDYRGPLTPTYDPHPDELPDPGEVVWTWVPFEEDFRQGKDRPVLIVGREPDWLLGLPLSSKNHELDKAQEAREGRFWIEIGSGPWDERGRGSAVRVNRVVRVDPGAVRRIGGRLDKQRFEAVARAVAQHNR